MQQVWVSITSQFSGAGDLKFCIQFDTFVETKLKGIIASINHSFLGKFKGKFKNCKKFWEKIKKKFGEV